MNIQEQVIKSLEEKKSALEFQMKLHSGLVKHNLILTIGAYTVENKGGFVKLTRKTLPSQFCSEGAKEILAIDYKNYLGETIKAKAVPYKEWYANELAIVNSTLDLFKV